MATETIEMDNTTKRFYQGVAAAAKVSVAHDEIEFPDRDTQVAYFWFYVGVFAGNQGCTTQDDFVPFLNGASVRQP